MILRRIKATNFKNYALVEIAPSPDCNVIFGENGSGKTNFLDMIHYSALSKSYFPITDKMAIRDNEEFTRIESNYEDKFEGNEVTLALSIPKVGSKKIWKNGEVIKKSTDILGVIPIVAIVPDDIELIKSSSDVRRKFVDRVLCQLSPSYTEALVGYQRVLKQKLAYFKSVGSFDLLDKNLVDTYDASLLKEGAVIKEMRDYFVHTFLPIFLSLYHQIAEHKEEVDVKYQSNFNQSTFIQDCTKAYERDYFTKRVSIGIHRDDLVFTLRDHPIRRYGSQGQIKTYVYALKLSEYLYLKKEGDAQPVLLLDDVFEKLDEERLRKLLELITSEQFGQIFISDTELTRSKNLLEELEVTFNSYKVEDQAITPYHG